MTNDHPEPPDGLMNAVSVSGICQGTCVMLDNDLIVYAGPLKGCPDTNGNTVLLHPEDFNLFSEYLTQKRH